MFNSLNKKIIVVSFFITKTEALRKIRAQWALRDHKHSKVLDKNLSDAQSIKHEEFGGSIVLMDPLKLEEGFLAEIPVPLAFGLCVDKNDSSLYVTSGSVIHQIKNGYCKKILDNNLFNDLHSISMSTKGNLIVVSTGIDSILEINHKNDSSVCWDWLAIEHGYNTTPNGQTRFIDRKLDYRSALITTPEHTTHVNTAFNDREDRILATLFHQGELIEIDRKSKQSKVILKNLSSPHNIRSRNNGFMISDTRANRVLLLDDKFKIKKEISHDFNWIQDALEFWDGGKAYYLIADSNNGRLVLTSHSGKIISSFKWEKDSRKVAAMQILTTSEANNIFFPST